MLEILKNFFDSEVDKTFENFENFCHDNKIRLADLSSGQYISKENLENQILLLREAGTNNRKASNELIEKMNILKQDLNKEQLEQAMIEINIAKDNFKNVKEDFEQKYNFKYKENDQQYLEEQDEVKEQLLKQAISDAGINVKFANPYLLIHKLFNNLSIDKHGNLQGIDELISVLKKNKETMISFLKSIDSNMDNFALNISGISGGTTKAMELKSASEQAKKDLQGFS